MSTGCKGVRPYQLNVTEGGAMPIILPTGSEERGVLGVGNISVAVLPSCHDMRTTAL